jgi:YbbR domain-containing protein
MRGSLFENLGLGALALLLSFLVWVGATFQDNPPKTLVFAESLAIEMQNRPRTWIIRNQSVSEVRVEVRGRQDNLSRLTASSFRAVADLAGLEAGLHQVPVEVECSDKSITIVRVEPPSISLTLDQQQIKEVLVQVNIMDRDSMPIGYTFRAPVVQPSFVTVSGPKTLVDEVTQASVSVWLQGSKTTVDRKLIPRLLDAQNRQIDGLTPDPQTVSVQVPIEQELGFRDVTVRAMMTGSPASGYWVSNILVQPTTVTVFGSPSALTLLGGFLETAPLDVSGAKADLAKTVSLNLPAGISVLSQEGQRGVQVKVQISAIVGGQTIQRMIVQQGLSLGLKATLSPTTVDVILSGPLPTLQELSSSEVQVTAELFGLSVGTHKVTPQAILVPEGLKVVSVVPATIEVHIELGP